MGASGQDPRIPFGDDDVFSTQKALRVRLLDNQRIRAKPARDLAAHMLLNIDNFAVCWELAVRWLRHNLGCSRVDSGSGTPEDLTYRPSVVEAVGRDYDVPSLSGVVLDNRDPVIQTMWRADRPLIFVDVLQDQRFGDRLRLRLCKARTVSKVTASLKCDDRLFGLICADWIDRQMPWRGDLYDTFESACTDVLGPILSASQSVSVHAECGVDGSAHTTDARMQNNRSVESLTPAELAVAKLAAAGWSYKRIARSRGRSLSTIDHQLRSIRQKMKVRSGVELVGELAKLGIVS